MRERKILDTSHLIFQWQRNRRNANTNPRLMARRLIQLYKTDAIVTPVAVEFLAGCTNRDEMHSAQAFLGEFRCIDDQNTPKQDWQETLRLVRRIPRSGKPRQLGDCLILAIARRLGHTVETLDKNFPQ